MGEGIIVQPAEKWRVLKGNILQCWESNERSKWSSIEKPLWKEGGEFGFYVTVRIWDLFSFYSDKTLLGCVFFSSIQTVYTSVILNFLMFTSSCLLKRNFFFFHFCYLGIFKDRATVCKTTHSHIYALMWIFLFSLPDWEINEIIQEYFVRDAIKSLYWFQCISAIILKLCVTFQ